MTAVDRSSRHGTPRRAGTGERTPGDLLLHPVAIAAVAIVIANDRVLKPALHNEVTGKLSDVAGLVFFPLLLVALAELVRRAAGRKPWASTPRAVLATTIAVGVAFVLIKTWPPAADVYRTAMGAVMWPVDALAAIVRRTELPPLERVALVEDRTDLLALPALVVPWWIATRVMAPAPSAQGDDR